MGDKYSYSHQNGGEISSGNLCRDGPNNPMRVDIFVTCDKRYVTSICASGIFYAGKKLPRLFFGKSKTLPPVVRNISMLPPNKSGMGLHNPVTSAAEKYTSSLRSSYKLIGAVTGNREFSATDHLWLVKEENWDRKKYQDDVNDAKIRGIVNDQGNSEKRLFLCAKHTGFTTVLYMRSAR